MLTKRKHVRDLAIALSGGKRSRVSASFFDKIEAATRKAISREVNHHDNVTGSRKTLV